MRRLRNRLVGRVLAKSGRDRRAARNSNQVGVEAPGEISSNADAAVRLALHVDVNHQRRIGHGSRSLHQIRMGFEFPSSEARLKRYGRAGCVLTWPCSRRT